MLCSAEWLLVPLRFSCEIVMFSVCATVLSTVQSGFLPNGALVREAQWTKRLPALCQVVQPAGFLCFSSLQNDVYRLQGACRAAGGMERIVLFSKPIMPQEETCSMQSDAKQMAELTHAGVTVLHPSRAGIRGLRVRPTTAYDWPFQIGWKHALIGHLVWKSERTVPYSMVGIADGHKHCTLYPVWGNCSGSYSVFVP